MAWIFIFGPYTNVAKQYTFFSIYLNLLKIFVKLIHIVLSSLDSSTFYCVPLFEYSSLFKQFVLVDIWLLSLRLL